MGMNRQELESDTFWHYGWGSSKRWLYMLVSLLAVVTVLGVLQAICFHVFSWVKSHTSAEVWSFLGCLPVLVLVTLFSICIVNARWCAIRHWRAIGTAMSEIKDFEASEYEGVYVVNDWTGAVMHVATSYKSRWGLPVVEYWSTSFPKGFDFTDSPTVETNEIYNMRFYRIRFRGVTRPETEQIPFDRTDRYVEITEVISCELVPSIFTK